MAIYNPLSWQNENALSSYPFLFDIDPLNLLVDARFVQFDSFVPTLNYIKVAADRLHISMTFDYGENATLEFLKSTYAMGEAYRNLRIYTEDASRYLGVIVFGEAAEDLWDNHVGRVLKLSAKFDPVTVRSIPSADAVYSLDGNHGEVYLSRTTEDKSIFYNTSLSLNSITFNAVTNHAIPESAIKQGLRQINLVHPLNNNINLTSNDVVKVKAFNGASLTVELVSGSSSQSFVVPTLIA